VAKPVPNRFAGVFRAAGRAVPPVPPDDGLLDRFRRDRDGQAFAAFVRRHGPAVLAACRRVLSDPADTDDAFQAAFLVLLRKVVTIDSETVGRVPATASTNAVRSIRNRVSFRASIRPVWPAIG